MKKMQVSIFGRAVFEKVLFVLIHLISHSERMH